MEGIKKFRTVLKSRPEFSIIYGTTTRFACWTI